MMKRRWLVSITIALLFIPNLVTLGLLIKAYTWDQMWLQMQLQGQASSNGAMWAMNDFRSGNLRQLRLGSAASGTIEDTGERDGPFEIWSWAYADGITGSRNAAEHFVAMYNSKMRHMYENPDAFLEEVADPPTLRILDSPEASSIRVGPIRLAASQLHHEQALRIEVADDWAVNHRHKRVTCSIYHLGQAGDSWITDVPLTLRDGVYRGEYRNEHEHTHGTAARIEYHPDHMRYPISTWVTFTYH